MKKVTMIHSLSTEREVFIAGKTYEIHNDKMLQGFLKSGIAKLENDPEPTNQFDDKLSDEEKNERKAKVDKRIAKMREDEKAQANVEKK
jgi:hypothetical protein